MSDKISMDTINLTSPQNLRKKYGDEIGNEICLLLPIVNPTNKAVMYLLNTLDNLPSSSQQMELLRVVWREYYKRIANSIL